MKKRIITSLLLLTLAAIVYSQTLTPPQFPGGKEAFSNFLHKNLKWPSDNMDDIQGVVIVGFFVEKDGKLTGISIEKGMTKAFNDEALRVISLSPKWIPAIKNNKPIKSRYTVPISFTQGEIIQ
ncbi:energy transducer TonB [Mucilaginibacter sp.]|uniref:energy transducer TonB n=1 Tax=Mucilaginibacter sp. TaxID=1882438 RepID=UPI0026006059|nr:energy transducer TonB [Mucilaginibacter sp.]